MITIDATRYRLGTLTVTSTNYATPDPLLAYVDAQHPRTFAPGIWRATQPMLLTHEGTRELRRLWAAVEVRGWLGVLQFAEARLQVAQGDERLWLLATLRRARRQYRRAKRASRIR